MIKRTITPLLLSLVAVLLVVGLVIVMPPAPPTATYAQAGPTTPPSVYNTAISALNVVIPNIGRPDGWRHEILGNSSEVGLGCATAPTTPLGRTVNVYKVWLRYADVEYLYHVAEDGSAITPCDPKIPGVAGTTGVADIQSSCRIDATRANVRSFPDSTVENIVGEMVNVSAPAIGRTADDTWYQVTLANGVVGWVAASASIAEGTCNTLPVTANAAVEFGPCPVGFGPDYLPTRIAIGTIVRVIPGGDPNVVRQQPSRTGERLGLLNPGTEVLVVGGPLCGGNYVWWQVSSSTATGWTVESFQPENDYYLETVTVTANPSAGTDTSGTGTGTNSGIGSTGSTNPAVAATGEVITAANVNRLTSILSLPSSTTYNVAYSPDGRYFASFDDTGVRVYTYPDYTFLSDLSANLSPTDPSIQTSALAFSADGSYLVLGYNLGTLWTVELATGTIFRLSPELQTNINVIQFDAENRVVIGTGSTIATAQPQLAVYDFARMNPATGELPRLLTVFSEDGPIFDAVILPNSDAVASIGLTFLEVRDISTNAVILRQQVVQRGASVVIAANGFATFEGLLALTAVGNQSVLLGWDIGDVVTQSITTIGVPAGVDALAIVPQAENVPPLLVVGVDSVADGRIRIYGTDLNQPIFIRDGAAWGLAVSPDGRHIALAGGDGQTVGVEILAVR